jgi:single-stranded-DNA-specific exonuclease
VASKLAEEFYKPTILIHLDGEVGKGSARSIPSFHIYEGLKECDDLLLGFGGHKYAAGLSISKEMIPMFKEKFKEVVSKNLKEADAVKQLNIDSVVNLSDLNMSTVVEIQRLAPFGSSNPHPLLCARGVKLSTEPEFIGKLSDHVRVNIEDDYEVMEIIAFNSRELFETLEPSEDGYDVAFVPELNSWGNMEKIRLRLQDIRPSRDED